jgi:hypothetical protein
MKMLFFTAMFKYRQSVLEHLDIICRRHKHYRYLTRIFGDRQAHSKVHMYKSTTKTQNGKTCTSTNSNPRPQQSSDRRRYVLQIVCPLGWTHRNKTTKKVKDALQKSVTYKEIKKKHTHTALQYLTTTQVELRILQLMKTFSFFNSLSSSRTEALCSLVDALNYNPSQINKSTSIVCVVRQLLRQLGSACSLNKPLQE